MTRSAARQRAAAKRFAWEWANRGEEKQERQKVIDPLFPLDLKAELSGIKAAPVQRSRRKRYELTFPDSFTEARLRGGEPEGQQGKFWVTSGKPGCRTGDEDAMKNVIFPVWMMMMF